MNRRELFATLAAPILKGQPRTPEANVQILEAVWNGVRDHFYDPRTRGVDWPAVKQEYLPRARTCASPDELIALLREMLSRLHNSHVLLYSREEWALRNNILPFFLEHASVHVYIRHVLHRDARPLADLLPGDEIVTVDGIPASEIRPLTLARLEPIKGNPNFGPAESAARVEALRGHQRIVFEVPRVRRPSGFDSVMMEHPRSGVAHLRFFTLNANQLPPDKLEPLWSEVANSRALILDLRNCVGGDPKIYAFIASSLLGPGQALFQWVPRSGSREELTPARTDSSAPRFEGRLAVIINSNTESEPEILAATCREYARGPVFGQRTAGAFNGPTRSISVPDGFALFAVPFARSISPKNVDYEQKGVEPNVMVRNTAGELERGLDAPLARAVRFLKT